MLCMICCSFWKMVIVWLLVSISPPILSRTVCGAVIQVKMVDLWQIRAFRLVTFLLASRSILGRGWKMQHRPAAQLQMNGAICLVTRGRRERLQPNCTWSPVLTPARHFPLQGKKQTKRREGERETNPAPSSTSSVPPEPISLPIIPKSCCPERRLWHIYMFFLLTFQRPFCQCL